MAPAIDASTRLTRLVDEQRAEDGLLCFNGEFLATLALLVQKRGAALRSHGRAHFLTACTTKLGVFSSWNGHKPFSEASIIPPPTSRGKSP